jgi:hypothetical protein
MEISIMINEKPVEVTDEDIEETLCENIAWYAKKGVLPDCNRYGVQRTDHKSKKGVMVLTIVTEWGERVAYEFDMNQLADEGVGYIHGWLSEFHLDQVGRREVARLTRKRPSSDTGATARPLSPKTSPDAGTPTQVQAQREAPMKKSTTPRQTRRERVKRCRDKHAGAGRTRVELSLDQATREKVERYAAERGESRSSALESIILAGLRVEREMG